MTRLAIVMSVPPPEHGPDAAVCVPLEGFASWEEHAASAVDNWERQWLLISSMPVRHRDEVRADLLHVKAAALVAAATNGIDSTGRPEDLLF